MQIFREIAGYSLGKADIVRRAMSKKKASVMEAERSVFVEGAKQNGMSEADAMALFEDMASFASYAFNKSHAASYAVLTYQTAYLKTHYMAEYMAALLTSVLGDFGKTAEYIGECTKAKIEVLPPHVNESIASFGTAGGKIRFGLLALKGVGRLFVDQIIAERKQNGIFTSFEDFITRMGGYDLNKRQVESLIKSGAFDGMGAHRSQLLASYEKIIENAQSKNRSELDGQIDFFSLMSEAVTAAPVRFVYPDIPEFPLREKLMLEKECSGMYFSGHILNDYSKHIDALGADSIADIYSAFEEDGDGGYKDRQTVTVAGMITKKTVKNTKNGETMAFVLIEDKTAEIEAVVFARQYERFADLLLPETPVAVRGTISIKDEEKPKILLNDCKILLPNADYVAEKAQTLYLRVPSVSDPQTAQALALIGQPKDGAEVVLYDGMTKQYVKAVGRRAAVTDALVEKLAALLGRENVAVK